MWKTRPLFVMMPILLIAAVATGQLLEDYRFKGVVKDTKGKPIPEARITFKNVDTGESFIFRSEKDGSFDRRTIVRGVYDVTFAKPGYVNRIERFNWTARTEESILKESDIILESDEEVSKRELTKKASKLYREAYEDLTSGKWDKAYTKAAELIEIGAGTYEYAARFVLARSDFAQGNLDRALTEYYKVIELKPDLFEAHYDVASILASKGDQEGALNAYRKAAELNSDDAETLYSIGAILFNTQRFDEAVVPLIKAVELNASHALAYRALGYAYLQAKEKNIPKGIESLKKYIELAPDAQDADRIKMIIEGIKQ